MLILLGLSVFAFLAGMIDAAAGGGGLIQLPALFNAFPAGLPATLFGTNKFASVCGTGFAARSFIRAVRIDWALALPATVAAFAGSFAGASVVSLVPKAVMRPLVLVLLVLMVVHTLRRRDFGRHHLPAPTGRRQKMVAAGLGGLIGFYDGAFGPGTGSFLAFLFVRVFGFDFLHATAHAKIVNVATNLAALAFFVPAGHVLWPVALAMAACNVAGAAAGSWLAVRKGAGFVRVLFLVLVAVLIGKMAWDMATGL